MDELERLLKLIRGISKIKPVTEMQLSEMIRKLWRPRVKTLIVEQEAHGFVVGTVIKPSATIWVKAQGNSEANGKATAVVLEVIDENQFIYVQEGIVPGDYIKGAKYLLSLATAGEVFVQADPEVWAVGQYRQMIGTGTEDGLLVEIDEGATINTVVGTFDKDFEFCIIAGVAESLVCDLSAAFAYTITKLIIESDGTLSGVSLLIGAVAVTGLSGLTVEGLAVVEATGANEVAVSNRVTLNTTTAYSASPTIVRFKIVYTR